MSILLRTLSALILLGLAGCAQTLPQQGEDEAGIHPALYTVRDRDSTMYLYGTVHVRPQGADWGNDDVREALDASQEIWTELIMSPEADAQAQGLAQSLGAAAPGQPLSSWLTQQENTNLNALTASLGIPQGALEGYKPWIASLTLTVVPLVRAGYDPASGVDRAIDAYGEARGKTMRALETPEQQLNFLAGLSPELQREMLREAIDAADEVVPMINQMTAAWEGGNEATLAEAVIDDTREQYPELYQTLFVDRNNAWIEVLTRELQGSGVDFVAVGAGHIIGRDGLAAMLRARGYRVERVE